MKFEATVPLSKITISTFTSQKPSKSGFKRWYAVGTLRATLSLFGMKATVGGMDYAIVKNQLRKLV